MGKGVGIDFGTTNSVAVIFDKRLNRITPLTDRTNNLPHPSVIWFRADGSVTVGTEAKKNIEGFSNIEGNSFVSSIKRHLGKDEEIPIFGRNYKAVKVASEIFDYLREDAENRGFEIKEAVVTIPVYFDGRARRELRKAAQEAGIFIKKFIHEPFAAIVGYFYRKRKEFNLSNLEGQTLLVFDWGGGTLDITVVKVMNGGLVELSTAGLIDRAGDHFDEVLVSYAKNGLLEQLGVSFEEVSFSPNDKDRLRVECEEIKKELSFKNDSIIQAAQACKYRNQSYNIKQPLNRAEFNNLIEKDVLAAVNEVHKALDNANVKPGLINAALLIGGSSKIPFIQEKLRELFGHRMIEVENPDTIIAEGAAIVDGLNLQPVLSKSINIELSDGRPYEIFKAGDIARSNICNKKINFFCTDNRDGEAKLVITEPKGYEESSQTTKKVLAIPVNSALPKPYNHERVTVHFALDDDMILHVSGKAATQDRSSKCEIFDICFGLQS